MRRAVIVGAAGVALVGLVAPVVVLAALTGIGSSVASSQQCTPTAPTAVTAGNVTGLDDAQLANAATIIAVGQATVGPQGEVIAVATSLVEADLQNLDHGDGTSLGLFQQIDTWGSASQRLDPVWAATQFYDHLLAVPGWQTMTPGAAAQAVQRSAFPDRYQAQIPYATLIVGNASPGTVAALGCPVAPPGTPPDVAAGIAARPAQIQTAIAFAFAQLGKPYVWGATGPESWDCSGLTQAAYAAAGITITRTTYTQVAAGVDVTAGPYLPGDLIFPEAGHVMLAISPTEVVEAPHTGAVVELSTIGPVWAARRILP